jgi:hypothetical protein
MARDIRWVSAVVAFLAIITGLAVGCGDASRKPTLTAPSPTAAPVIQTSGPAPGQIAIDGGLTEMAVVGGEIDLDLAVTNVGPRDIQELTIVISDAYMAKLTVMDTMPSATRHNEQGGEYFIFGALPSGQTLNYHIGMSPREPGRYEATVFLTDLTPTEIRPLLQAGGGEAQFTDLTEVVTQ